MANAQAPTAQYGETNLSGDAIRRHSVMFLDSDSEGNERSSPKTVDKGISSLDYFDCFVNKFTKATEGERLKNLKAYREDSNVQNMAKAVFDFSMTDANRFKFLFETGKNLKLMWQFIYLSFFDQELLMLELKHRQHAEDFNRINAFQIENGVIAKKDGPKVYRLFKLFCLKDRVFNSLVIRERKVIVHVSTETVADNNKPSAMEVESGWKLPDYTDTEMLMDDMGLTLVDFMSRFEKFKVDEISIDDAEDDICFNAKEHFEDSPMMSLIRLRFTEDESTIDGRKEKWSILLLDNFQKTSKSYLQIMETIALFFLRYIQKM